MAVRHLTKCPYINVKLPASKKFLKEKKPFGTSFDKMFIPVLHVMLPASKTLFDRKGPLARHLAKCPYITCNVVK